MKGVTSWNARYVHSPIGFGLPSPANANAAASALRKFVDAVDILRQLTSTLNRPLDDWNLPHP